MIKRITYFLVLMIFIGSCKTNKSTIGESTRIMSANKVIKKFEEKKRELISVNEQLKDEIFNSKKTTKWVNWIDDFKNKIDDLRTIETFVENSAI